MSATTIGWTDHSVNPIRARHRETGRVGHYCEKISQGCTHCYSSRMQSRFGMPPFQAQRKDTAIEPWLDTSKFADVLRRKIPTKFFWCDMSDLFGAWVPDAWIDQCLAVMWAAQWHVHQVLTKRAARMQQYMTNPATPQRIAKEAYLLMMHRDPEKGDLLALEDLLVDIRWPLPNVWLGVSVENQAALNRLTPLCETPAAVRFASLEPLLEDLGDLTPWLQPVLNAGGLDWVIAGGESGPRARPCNEGWIRAIVQQCQAAGTAIFVKQLGAHSVCGAPGDRVRRVPYRERKGSDPFEWPHDLRVQCFPDK
jgi:protein gp37